MCFIYKLDLKFFTLIYQKNFFQECFNAPYGIKYFNEYAEEIPGYTSSALSQSAKQNSIYLIGGINFFVSL